MFLQYECSSVTDAKSSFSERLPRPNTVHIRFCILAFVSGMWTIRLNKKKQKDETSELGHHALQYEWSQRVPNPRVAPNK